MAKIAIIGITHVDNESQEKVSRILKEIKPDAVCLELDDYRLQTLQDNALINNSNITDVEFKPETKFNETQKTIKDQDSEMSYTEGFTAVLEDIGFFESELSRITKTDQPGNEMLIAYNIAKELGSKIYLVDRSINEISKVLDEEVSSEEAKKFQELVDELVLERKIIAQPLDNQDESTDTKKHLNSIEDISDDDDDEINLNEVLEIFKDQESLNSILSLFNENFPMLYSILLEDRNLYMSKQILKVAHYHSSIVIILGYGHVAEVAKLLKKHGKNLEIEIMN